ncbi:hypothetical protein N9R65_03060 [Opitutales bacterium]|nr:hypothetical protein [Opitutales bacterium]MDB2681522.1 hypothetical protein [Opitutales bacterium]
MVKLSIFCPEGVSVRMPIGQLSEHIAKGSSGEVRSMYRLDQRLKLIDSSVVDERCGQCKSIGSESVAALGTRQLGGFAKYLRQTKK